jgi:hypothetical protein
MTKYAREKLVAQKASLKAEKALLKAKVGKK